MKDIAGLKKEALSNRDRLSSTHALGSEELDLINRLVDLVDEALNSSIEDFKINLTDIVDCVEEDRSQIEDASIKALYTRLIFVLSRCSRLLITEQLHMFAREPHSRRFATSMGRAPAQALRIASPDVDEEDGAIFRNHTMPVKVMKELARKLREQEMAASAGGATPDPSQTISPENSKRLYRIPSSGDRGTPSSRPSVVSRGGSSVPYHQQHSSDSRHSPHTPQFALTPLSPTGSLPTVPEVPSSVSPPSFANRILNVMSGRKPASSSPPSSPMGARAPFSSPLMSEEKKKSKGFMHKLRKTAKKTIEGLKRMVSRLIGL